MTAWLTVLGGLAVILAGVAAWLGVRLFHLGRENAAAAERLASGVAEAERLRGGLEQAASERDAAERNATDLGVERAKLIERLDAEKRMRAEHEATLTRQLAEAHAAYEQAIKSTAGQALRDVSAEFRDWAKRTFENEQKEARSAIDARMNPFTQALTKTDETIGRIERERLAAYARLATEINQMGEVSASLRKETGNLVNALRKPQVRGRYGEVQLRRVVELAGMRDYCDFDEQASARDDEGRLKRPDLIVRLPNERCVVVDAKTNIEAYIEATQASDPDQAEACLRRFAGHVLEQARALAKKAYWSEHPGAYDLVVMFIPGEQFIDAALQREPGLLDLAGQDRVILASPSTLIGLLRAVYVGWREKDLSDRANELFELGRELHKRAAVAFEHASAFGAALNKAVDKYGDFVGSVERQMLPTLRKFEEAGARSDKDIPVPAAIETSVRTFRALPASGPPAPA